MTNLRCSFALLALFMTITASQLGADPRHRLPQDAPEMDFSSATAALSGLGLACVLLRKRK